MTEDAPKFSKLRYKHKGRVSFGNNKELKVIGRCNINLNSNFIIRDALLVKGMKFNLIG